MSFKLKSKKKKNHSVVTHSVSEFIAVFNYSFSVVYTSLYV